MGTKLVHENATDFYEKINTDEMLENIFIALNAHVFTNGNNVQHYIDQGDINESQNIINMVMSDGSKFELKLKKR